MENNGTNKAQDNGQQNSANVVSFPSNHDTQLSDIYPLLKGAPVIQQAAPTDNSSATAAAKGSRTAATGSEIATTEDFNQVEEKPFARKIGPRTVFGAGLALLALLPLATVFSGGGSNDANSEQTAEVSEASTEEGRAYVSVEEYAAQQAELEQLRSQQAFINQQVDAEAIDAAGRQRQQANPSTRTASSTATSSSTASRPARPTAAVQPSSVTVRSAPVPSIATAPYRPAPVTIASRAPAPTTTSQPSAQTSARAPEAVDPFERRAQLQALGSYGTPPPLTKATQTASYEPSNPFEIQYVQALDRSPQPASATSRKATQAIAPDRPLTSEELQYEQDAAAVLATKFPGEQNSVAAVEAEQLAEAISEQPEATTPAIMPGTSTAADLPHGFSWQEGAPLPEVLLLTTEDIMAGKLAVIPAGTQFLGQAQIDPNSGAVTIQIVGLFGETRNIQIPRSSVIVQAEDGSVLTASASGGASRTSGPNMGSFFMQSLGNGLSNAIDSDDNLVTDIAGGMAETMIDNQVKRAEADAAARSSRTAAQPIIWTLNSRSVRLTFNNYIPVSNALQ